MLKKVGILVGVVLVACATFLYMERDRLEAFFTDEIVVTQSEPVSYIAEQGYHIRNNDWIYKALESLEHLEPISGPKPPTYAIRYTFRVNGKWGLSISQVDGEWVMDDDGKLYKAPKDFIEMLAMPRSDFLKMDGVDGWTDWALFVKIDGVIHVAQSPQIPYREGLDTVFQVKKLPDDPGADFTMKDIPNHSGFFGDGTPVYRLDGKFYVRDLKEPDVMDVLAPVHED
ncbi:MAG TPA: hypothetical protein VFK44_10110 [Bacillales bacterium]|nr:hypothetical protein [Bacillales bacterium]